MAINQLFWKNSLTGGDTNALDGIASSGLVTDFACITITSTDVYFHLYDSTSAAAESSPTTIAPDDIGVGNGRWIASTNFLSLINNVISDALHRHSELVASDGNPDPALSVDASGNVGIGTASPQSSLHLGDATTAATGIKLRSDASVSLFAPNNAQFTIVSGHNFSFQTGGIRFLTSGSGFRGLNNGQVFTVSDAGGTSDYLDFANTDTGGYTTINTAGASANIDLILSPKGTGSIGIGTTTPANGGLVVADGVTIGTDSTNNLIDDASNGAGSQQLFIGNASIDVTFTGCHYYQLGDLDLEAGECVDLIDEKIYRSTTKASKKAIGIFWGVTRQEDAFGNILNIPKVEYEDYKKEIASTEVIVIAGIPESSAFVDVEIEEPIINEETGKPITQNSEPKYKMENGRIVQYIDQVPVTKTVIQSQLNSNISLDTETGKLWKKQFTTSQRLKKNTPLVKASDGATSVGQLDYAYSVAVIGDSYSEHTTTPLTGAWVTVDAGIIKEGDLLCSSASKPGYLQKQMGTAGLLTDHIVRSSTVAKAGQAITEDTKTAYIYFLN